jgi:hypothetical protein
MKDLEEISNAFNEAMKYVEEEQEKFWESLSKDDQLKVFCAVCRRIYKGEVQDQRSYRGVLYDVFGFGPEAYGQAQVAGYLSIHNAIFTSEQEHQMLQHFAKWLKIENPEEKVSEYYRETY